MKASAARADDIEALYRRFGPLVFRLCRRLLSSDADAQDCLQDTFIGYLKGEWRGEAQPLTVLYRIATCRAIDRVRRQARWHGRGQALELRDQPDGTLEQQATLWAQERTRTTDVERAELAEDIALLLRGEDEETVTAAVMHWVEGYSLEEVAQTLGVTRKTVAARLTRLMERAAERSRSL